MKTPLKKYDLCLFFTNFQQNVLSTFLNLSLVVPLNLGKRSHF